MKNKKLFFSIFIFLVAGILSVSNFSFAQTCPSNTTVSGTSVTFVGELTDMGGDSATYVWFEYGTTSQLGQKTNELTLSQAGIYCIAVSGLSPCTTYYYRAGARNSAGTSYGEMKTFTTTCVGASGNINVRKLVRDATTVSENWLDSIRLQPAVPISFKIQITPQGFNANNVIVKDILPSGISYKGNLKLDGQPLSGDIFSGINIGAISNYQTKTITFDAEIAQAGQFFYGENKLYNSVTVSSEGVSGSDNVEIVVVKGEVAGIATSISTGFKNTPFFNPIFLSFIFSLVLVWVFKFHILAWEEWLERRKEKYHQYRSNKILLKKISQIKKSKNLDNLNIKR